MQMVPGRQDEVLTEAFKLTQSMFLWDLKAVFLGWYMLVRAFHADLPTLLLFYLRSFGFQQPCCKIFFYSLVLLGSTWPTRVQR